MPYILLSGAISLLYGQFLWNPVFFDDIYFFDGTVHSQYLGKFFSLDLRWLPYATFEWTRALFGLDLIWFHLVNLVLHIFNVCLLFIFLRRLFQVVASDHHPQHQGALSFHWLAFFAALIFALHPAAVYAAAYLSQRSMLMATFFTLLTWYLFLEGLISDNKKLLLASAVAYFFGVLSKEHVIMAPAVSALILLLLHKLTRAHLKKIVPTFVLYTVIALFVVIQVKYQHILGQAYEGESANMLARLARLDPGFDPSLAYPLSILTQSFLFFKYLLLWIAPSPLWMSIDMYETFALRLWAWPQIFGFIAFILYPILALRLVLQHGVKSLLGFALLCPWLMFITEFSTVRIQETFVIYRSYVWIIGAFAALPFAFQYLSAKRSVIILSVISIGLIPLTWERLTTFSHPLLLWDDAARLIENKEDRPGVERIYYNRGIMLARSKLYPQAIADFDKAIAIYPEYSYALNDRGAAYYEMADYLSALANFNKAIDLNPQYPRSYIGRAETFEALNHSNAARSDYELLCQKGIPKGCLKLKGLSSGH